MRAALVNGEQQLEIGELDDPAPGPGQVVLRVTGCGVCGSDLHMIDHLPRGVVMGHEFCGEVVAIGHETAGRFRVGDAVCSIPIRGCGSCLACLTGDTARCGSQEPIGLGRDSGAYAEYVVVGERETFPLPEQLAVTDGALVEPLAVGLHAVEEAGLSVDDDVLIIGAGPVGLAVAHWCRHFGAREVIVSDPVEARREFATRFGASASIDPGAVEVGEEAVRLAGRSPQVVFECVGVPGMIGHAVDCVGHGSTVVVAGVCMGPDSFLPLAALQKEIAMKFVMFYRDRDFRYTIDMLAAERIAPTPMITNRVTLDELPAAFQALRTPSTECKVIWSPT